LVKERGLKISVDPRELTTVLANLIKNAQEAATSEGSVRVLVCREGTNGVVRVEDDGAGMSEEFIRKRLFRPFDSTKGSQGMGIGVYQAREYARRIGGDLAVDSVVGSGTRIDFRLPLIIGRESQLN
jgi:signal transduction histidine kinase